MQNVARSKRSTSARSSKTLDAGSAPSSSDDAPRAAGKVAIVAVRGGKATESTSLDDLPRLLRDKQAIVWIDLTGPSPDEVAAVAETLGLHPLIVEDIIESNERAKVVHVRDVIHLVLFALSRESGPDIHIDELDFVLGRRILLSVHPPTFDPRAAHQLKMGVAEVLVRGPDALLWAVSDSVVDGYFPVFDKLADEIDDLEDRILDRPNRQTLEQVFAMKRELIKIRHVVAPSREIFNQLTSREYDLIGEAQILYFRDVYDHLIRLTDEFDTFRELTAAIVEVYLSTINNNLSTIMKRLTGVTVILAGVGAIAGIFGMSEAGLAFSGGEAGGFWTVTAAVVAITVVAAGVLRRIDWI
jgi:magnesium transporter